MIYQHRFLLGLLILYTLLTTWMSLHTPPFEAPDAYYHFAVIEHRARTNTPPPYEDAQSHPWRQMTFHAPLYYELSAGLIRLVGVDTSDFYDTFRLNPHAQIGEPSANDNQNFIAHVDFGWQGSALAIRLIRGFSLLLGGLTLVSIYAGAWYYFRGDDKERHIQASFATACVLVIPQYTYLHGVVTNDTLVTALSALTLALLIRQVLVGVTTWGVVVVALVLAFNSLAKTSGMTLYPIVALGFLWACHKQGVGWRIILAYGLVGIGAWVVIAGGWYWHNWQMLGDATATSAIADATGARQGGIADLVGELRGMYYSFWGLFGWFNIAAPSFFYTGVSVFLLMSMGGVVMRLWRLRQERPGRDHCVVTGLLMLYVVIYLVSWWQFHQMVNAGQGRLLFPLLLPIAFLVGWGLMGIPRVIAVGSLISLAVVAFSLPLTHLQPAYHPASPVAEISTWQAPSDVRAFDFRQPWEENACLRAWVMPAKLIKDGTVAQVNLWWQALCPISGYWSIFLHWVDVIEETCVSGVTDYVLAQYDTMPNGGRLPFPLMLVDAIYEEQLTLARPPGLEEGRVWYLQLGLYDAGGGSFIRAFIESENMDDLVGIGQCAPESILYRLPK